MSIASTIPSSLKLSTSSSSSSATTTKPLNSSRNVSLRPSITASNAEGPLRRPVAPLREPNPPLKPVPPTTVPSSPSFPSKPASLDIGPEIKPSVITLEYQRKKAKELQDYFREKKIEEANEGPFFGFIGKNEIANGRWAMFGFAVGLLTEYATGSDFVDQLKILLSNFGIVDLE
ncbi:hypothetical protein AMTRI_Chr12g240480 [Amborella trichopoda]|uniref:Uncharacterized protein n=1 Tax=Amborella trichopoda TaxID=13333 RepID=W1PJC9_AMBTC|nr:light-harvesting complex-like protein OHP2, chloroplastic [Amborella trichopoda]ERN07185.1 hypothetical protein AMTR_s00019p00159010 [Amborella trichopoda]|eukprot:XP_006845510.1 light-harvesting complex-like protein OHP2, chloroplastic [Amborella trichopoda]